MMKKLSCLLILLLLCTTTVGCMSEYANDPNNGEILKYENKYAYIDGTYLAYGTYYNNEGYVPAMQLTVKNGIINRVRFDLFDTVGTAYSEITDPALAEEISLFNTEVKSLNSALLQAQTYTQLDTDNDTNTIYHNMASALFANLTTGVTDPIPVDFANTYSALGAINTYGFYPILTVSYSGALITQTSFAQLDAQNHDIADLKTYTDLYDQKNDLSYRDAIAILNTLPNDKMTLGKSTEAGLDKDLLAVYNKLAAVVAAKHQPYQSDPLSLFSSK